MTNQAVEVVEVKISLGRELQTFRILPNSTCGALLRLAESRFNCVEGGIKVVHKGDMLQESKLLQSVGVTSGTKMLAFRTQKQRDVDKENGKLACLQRPEQRVTNMKAALDDHYQKASNSEGTSAAKAPIVLGDPVIEGQDFVLILRGPQRFRININLTETVRELKTRLGGLPALGCDARNVNLLFRGRFLSDEMTLVDAGASSGCKIMSLFTGRHHRNQEGRAQLEKLAVEVEQLGKSIHSLQIKLKHRLLDDAEASLLRGEHRVSLQRLRGNLKLVQSHDERRVSELLQKLDGLEEVL